MNVDYEDALQYPLRGEDALVRHLIGGGIPALLAVGYVFVSILSFVLPFFFALYLFVFPVGLVVGIFVTGYFVHVLRATYEGDANPPSIREWGAIFKDGAYAFVISLVYSIPLIFVSVAGAVLFFVVVGGGMSLGPESEGLATGLGVAGLLIFLGGGAFYFLYSLVMGYLVPISVCAFADEGSLSAAFDTAKIKPVATRSEYALTWLGYMAVASVVQTVIWMLTMVLVGYLLLPLLPFLFFFAAMAMYRVFGQVYADEMGLLPAETPRSPSTGGSTGGPTGAD